MTTFPSVPIRSYRIDLNQNKAISESSFTRKRQVVTLSAGTSDRWEGFVTTPRLQSANRIALVNWLFDTGLYGQFTMPHPDYSAPASAQSNGSVLGGSQTGISLIADGFSNSTLILAKGEYFQIGNEFKRVTADATSNGSGEVTINFLPALRVSPDDNDTLVLNNPVMTLELLNNPGEEMDYMRLPEFTIQFQEALISE